MHKKWLATAAISGFLAVGVGAFGAHALNTSFSDYDRDIFKTASNYHMWHSLLLAAVSLLPARVDIRWLGRLLVAGILLFSGSLYALAICKIKQLGIITPFGGIAFLLAWAILARIAFRLPEE
jgi:uncharacterized membrane protein YgdD (TMEM256/DUF423 family)